MTVPVATAVSRITLDFLRYGHPGMRLEAIEDENAGKPVHAKWQAMIQARRFGLLARARSKLSRAL